VLVFAIAGALRLARFNVTIDDPTSPPGTPNSLSACRRPPAPDGVAALYLHFSVLELPASKAMTPFYIVYVLGIAFLMASRIPHFSGSASGAYRAIS
jgi:CDP-diacylglycerol--serine O-phosphatidyltransferase